MIKLSLDLSAKQLLALGLSSIIFFLVVTYHFFNEAGKTPRYTPKQKCKAEITMLVSAIRQYEDRFESFPKYSSGTLNFGEYFSKVPVNDEKWKGKRPMFINFIMNNIEVSNDDFAEHNAKETIVYDPYGSAYHYNFIKANFEKDESFEVISKGEDGVLGTPDDINSSTFL